MQVVQRLVSDNQPLLMRHNGRVVIGDQSPAPMLLYPHSSKASVVRNCVAFILPIHGREASLDRRIFINAHSHVIGGYGLESQIT